jgi:hypothetical protein
MAFPFSLDACFLTARLTAKAASEQLASPIPRAALQKRLLKK